MLSTFLFCSLMYHFYIFGCANCTLHHTLELTWPPRSSNTQPFRYAGSIFITIYIDVSTFDNFNVVFFLMVRSIRPNDHRAMSFICRPLGSRIMCTPFRYSISPLLYLFTWSVTQRSSMYHF